MKKKEKTTYEEGLALMGVLHGTTTQQLIHWRQMVDEELEERNFDIRELKLHRRKKFIKFLHWLKYGEFI